MKKAIPLISVFLFSTLLSISQDSTSQTCRSYFPLNKGNKTELSITNGSGSIKGKIIYEITGLEHLGKRNKSILSTIYFDEKNTPFYVSELAAVCYKNNTDLDIIAILPFDIIKKYKNSKLKTNADKIDLPIRAKALDKLRDGNVDIEIFVGNKKVNDINLNIFNRQVDAIENIITPLGEFKCIKTSYSLKTNSGKSKFNKVIEWYSQEVGLIKFERYNKSDKLIEKGEISKIDK